MGLVGNSNVVAPFANEAMRLLREDWKGKYGAKMLAEELFPILQTGIPQPDQKFENFITINAGNDDVFAQLVDKFGTPLFTISDGGLTKIESPGYPPPKLKPRIVWGLKTIAVGGALSGTELDAVAVDPETGAEVPGVYVYDPASGTTMDVAGTASLYVDFTPTDGVKYRTAMGRTTIHVIPPAAPTFVFQVSGPTSFNNENSLSAQGLSISDFKGFDGPDPETDNEVSGTISTSPSLNTTPDAPSITVTVTFTPNNLTAYEIGEDDFDYDVSGARTPIINWSDPADISQGTPLSGTQLNATATDPVTSDPVPGTFTYDPVSGTVLDEGDGQILSVHFDPDDTDAYLTPDDKTVTINVTGGEFDPFNFLSARTLADSSEDPPFTTTIEVTPIVGSPFSVSADIDPGTDALPDTTPGWGFVLDDSAAALGGAGSIGCGARQVDGAWYYYIAPF